MSALWQAFAVVLLCSLFVEGLHDISVDDDSGVAAARWSSTGRRLEEKQLPEQENGTMTSEEPCDDEGASTFTTFVHVSATMFTENATSGGVDDLGPAFMRAYNEYHSSTCERGGVTIDQAKVVDTEGGQVLIEIEASCLGCSKDEGYLFMRQTASQSNATARKLRWNSKLFKRRQRRRNLQTSNSSATTNSTALLPPCFCEPPLTANFTTYFRDVLTSQSYVGTDDVLDVTELMAVTEDCETLPLSTYSAFVGVYFTQEGEMTASELAAAIENAALETYNRINTFDAGNCDPLGRRVESANASAIDSAEIYQLRELTGIEGNLRSEEVVLLELSLTCLGCGESDRKAFDTIPISPDERRHRDLQALPHQCLCPVKDEGIVYRGPTTEEFAQELSAILPGLGVNRTILDVQEMTSAPCLVVEEEEEGTLVNLSEVVLLDFVLDCSLVDADSAFLANQFVGVYNKLSQYRYCDPHARRLSSAEVLRREASVSNDGTLTMELRLNGTCIGCDPFADGFYYVPVESLMIDNSISINEAIGTEFSNIESNSTNATTTDTNSTDSTSGGGNRKQRQLSDESKVSTSRFLSHDEDVCYCPVEAVGARAPSEAEVMDEFRSFVQQASEEIGLLRCVTSVGQCQFGTTFESSFLASFDDMNTTLEFVSDIESLLQDTLNGLFANRVGLCRPDFRMVQSVRATIGVGLAGEDLRRHLENLERRGQENISLTPGALPTGTPTTAFSNAALAPGPSTSTVPSDELSMSPTGSPTRVFRRSVLVLMLVTGICNGCSNDLLLQDQVIGGSTRLEQEGQQESFSRGLQTLTEEPESNCFCPIESVVQQGNPTADSVLVAYQNQLESSDVPVDVTTVQEVQVLDCEDEVEDFESQIVLRFSMGVDVSDRELRDLRNLIRDTYNDLTEDRFCDPLIRRIDELDIDSIEFLAPGQDGCVLVEITFDLFGKCRGCEDDSALFDIEEGERRMLMHRETPDGLPKPSETQNRHRRRRRRLKSSDVCLCDRRAEADRAPTFQEFEKVLGFELEERKPFEFICGLSSQFAETPDNDEPSNAPSSAPSASPTACTATLERQFQSEIVLYVEDGDRMDTETKTLLGEALQTAYNELIEIQLRLCDPLYREVTSIALLEEETQRRQLRGSEDQAWHRGRMLQDNQLGTPLRYDVVGRCEACDATSNILDAVGGEDLATRVRELVGPLVDGKMIFNVFEVDLIACSSAIAQFNEVVIVELVPTCLEDENFGLTDDVMFAIEETFVATYNDLASLYCDQYFTVVTDAEFENVGTITEDGNLPIEIRVFAECLGCDPQESGICGNPSAISRADPNTGGANGGRLLFGGNRFLQDSPACVCSAQALAERPPSESEFIEAFRDSVEELPLECVASVGECQFGSTFTTDIVLSFEGNQTTLTDEVRLLIQRSFIELLNDLYEPNEDVCNPEFRVVIDVAVVFDFTLNGEFIESGANATSSNLPERNLEVAGSQLQDQEGNLTTGPPLDSAIRSSPPTGAPTTVFDSNFQGLTSDLSVSPTAAPTSIFAKKTVRTLLTVAGVCNGCVNDLFLANQVLGGRELKTSKDATNDLDYLTKRTLEEGQSDRSSNCFCPLTAIVNLVPPSPEEVEGALSVRLEEEDVDLVVQNIDTVSAIACDDETETTEFTSEFTFAFAAFESVPDLELERLGSTIASVYNDLVEEYCDPLIRREVVLELVDRSRVIASVPSVTERRDLQEQPIATDEEPRATCVNFEATFAVQGLCRGCDRGTPLLDGRSGNRIRSLEAHNRILSSGQRPQRTRRRHLERDDEECFCDSSTIAPRAPNLEELWLRLGVELGSFVEICGQPVQCNPTAFVSQFSETTILALVLEKGTILSDVHLFELEAVYLTAYNAMQSNLREDKCGGNFRQLDSITVNRGILGDESNDAGSGRRLSVQSLSLEGIGGCPRPCEEVRTDLDVIFAIIEEIRSVSFIADVIAVNELITGAPSSNPSTSPSNTPSSSPSSSPSKSPSASPSSTPSTSPSSSPSSMPSTAPSTTPSTTPSTSPSTMPSMSPSSSPSSVPSKPPSLSPSSMPSKPPSLSPSTTPSTSPSTMPSMSPSSSPSSMPSKPPSSSPSTEPSASPSTSPSTTPSIPPSTSANPSGSPSSYPSDSVSPSVQPSSHPSTIPSFVPSLEPSVSPSTSPLPSDGPSSRPSFAPPPYAIEPDPPCKPPVNLCDGGWTGSLSSLAPGIYTTLPCLGPTCKGQSSCPGPTPPTSTLTNFNSQCASSARNGATFEDASCVFFPNDGSIEVSAEVCFGIDSCNCVAIGTGMIEGGPTACSGDSGCNYNTGTIGSMAGPTCNGWGTCNCNAGTILGAGGREGTANFNNGLIDSQGRTTCSDAESCNYNNFEGFGSPPDENVRITGQACTSRATCNGNMGKIDGGNQGGACNLGSGHTCNCNRGHIDSSAAFEVCRSTNVCNNVPSCIRIFNGCNTDGSCNFQASDESCCLSASTDCCDLGTTGISATNCEDSSYVAPTTSPGPG